MAPHDMYSRIIQVHSFVFCVPVRFGLMCLSLYLLASTIAGLNAGRRGDSRRAAAAAAATTARAGAALHRTIVAQDLSLVPFLPHGRRVGLADAATWLQAERHPSHNEYKYPAS